VTELITSVRIRRVSGSLSAGCQNGYYVALYCMYTCAVDPISVRYLCTYYMSHVLLSTIRALSVLSPKVVGRQTLAIHRVRVPKEGVERLTIFLL
jgi:hypothetical protein